MIKVFSSLVSQMKNRELLDLGVIPWSTPVPFFGDPQNSLIATMGLNPSNREFEDKDGMELQGYFRRFPTLRSLEISSWKKAKIFHEKEMYEACKNYFDINPYGQWFNALDKLINEVPSSYYNSNKIRACHLDLIPYATYEKWGTLTGHCKNMLINLSANPLASILKDSKISVVILNGKSVVENFEVMSEVKLEKKIEPSFQLTRKSGKHVIGISYSGLFRKFRGVDLGREIKVIGFNHNIQSSFGVTNVLKESIMRYITKEARGMLSETR